MAFRFIYSLRFRLILLVLLIISPAFVLILYRDQQERQLLAEQIKQDQLRLAKIISHHHYQLIENTRHILYTLAQLPQFRQGDAAGCSQIFADLLKQYPWYLNIGAAYPDGRVFASALPFKEPVSIPDRFYFQQAIVTRQFATGEYQIGRITGKPSLNFGYPIIDEKGNIRGVVYVALSLAWFEHLLAFANLPSGSSLSIINNDGVILASFPNPEKWVGEKIANSSLFKALLKEKEGTVEAIGLDNVPHLYSFTSMEGTDRKAFITVGISKKAAFGRIDESTKRSFLLLALLSSIGILVAWLGGHFLVLRCLKNLIQVVKKLEAGDFSIRAKEYSCHGEFGELAHSFNEMASRLEQRNLERKQAEETLKESERRYRELANLLPGIVFETDEQGKIIFASKKAFEVMGYSPKDLEEGLNVFQFVAIEDLERAKETFADVLKEEKSNLLFTLVKKDGSKFPALVHTRPIFKEGIPVGLRGIAVDITELKKTEEKLREKEAVARKLAEEARQLAEENEVIAEIGRIISSTLHIEEVYEGFAKEVRKLIPFDKISINIVDFEKNTVTLPYVTGKPVAGRNVNDVFPLAGSFTEGVIKQKRGIIFHPANEDEVISRFPGHLPVYRAGLRSAMMVPLITKGKAIATLNFMAESANAYAEHYLRLAEKVANQIAGAVANAQLYSVYGQTLKALEKREEEARALAKENEIIANIGRIISSTLDINKVYEAFGEEVHKVIPFHRIAITLIDYEKEISHTAYGAGVYVPSRGPGEVFPLRGSFTEEVMRQRKGVLIQTEDGKELMRRFPQLVPVWQSGLRSFIGIPLISQDKVIGVLHIYSLNPNAYQEAQLDLGQRIGNQIAGAIANAQLFAQHERLEKERMALEEQFRQAQKMEAVGRLAGGIAHDFNNSLTMIKVAAQLAQMDMKGDSPLKEKFDIILEATDKSANLARQLLAFSRKQVMDMKVIDLNLLLKELDKMLHRIIGEDIELNYLLAEDLKKVKVDPGQIEQVILNLALNARDAMPNGGKLVIETANVELDDSYVRIHKDVNPGHYVLLSVSDTGIGMTPEVKEHIFEPFFTTKAKGKGTGLGLSTVYGIVKQSGGHIWVYSEPGKGATFKIYLPAVDEPVEEIKKRETEAGMPMGKETILIVEDNEEVRKLAEQILTRLGYRVISAAEGNEALDVCDKYKEPIHLLLTDVVMPGMSGRNLAEAISILRPETKVLYMSGYPDEVISDLGVLKPGINYLQKPFTVEILAKKVREVLDKKNK